MIKKLNLKNSKIGFAVKDSSELNLFETYKQTKCENLWDVI